MFTPADLNLIREKGLTPGVIEDQLSIFRKGIPYLNIIKPATPGDGILQISDNVGDKFVHEFEKAIPGITILKFVPASGAASRMFKSLFEFYYSCQKSKKPAVCKELMEQDPEVEQIFKKLDLFAFYNELQVIAKQNGYTINKLLKDEQYNVLAAYILSDKGLNYGNLPKGLIKFHKYPEGERTAMGEHFVEGALYGKNNNGIVKLHFTVSPEHRMLFEDLVRKVTGKYEKQYGAKYNVSFSYQKPSTDTIAVDPGNQPFRTVDGGLLFRPGGHGALLENLNETEEDIVFIKNIDNVAPDRMKGTTIRYKKILAVLLISIRKKIYYYLREIDSGNSINEDMRKEISDFIQKDLYISSEKIQFRDHDAEVEFFRKKLNRPIRICGMVRNEGEPGGGPFIAVNQDNTFSPQIVESSQIDLSKPGNRQIMKNTTHFNPVDLVCGLRDYRGRKFDLLKYRDMNTGLISNKSKDGRDLKALELPGLWYGAMSDWNTVFVEVPIETFNPVKTINDLLRPEHQPQ